MASGSIRDLKERLVKLTFRVFPTVIPVGVPCIGIMPAASLIFTTTKTGGLVLAGGGVVVCLSVVSSEIAVGP